jgi:hypothetical protein
VSPNIYQEADIPSGWHASASIIPAAPPAVILG